MQKMPFDTIGCNPRATWKMVSSVGGAGASCGDGKPVAAPGEWAGSRHPCMTWCANGTAMSDECTAFADASLGSPTSRVTYKRRAVGGRLR